jgi:hypothetical protein
MYIVGTNMSKFKNKLHTAAVMIAALLALNTAFNAGAVVIKDAHSFFAVAIFFPEILNFKKRDPASHNL